MLERYQERKISQPQYSASYRVFTRNIFFAFGLLLAGIVVFWFYQTIILAFAAILLALAIRALANLLTKLSRIPDALAVALVVLLLAAAVASVGWLFGSQLATQFNELASGLPESLSVLQQDISSNSWGAWLVNQIKEADLSGATTQIASHIAAFFGSAFRALAYTAVLLFSAVYLALQPLRYRNAILGLVPSDRRNRIAEIADLTGATLRRWIVGQAVTMAFVGALTALGLWALGIPAPFALGLIAGVFAFVPYLGPILASVPGILMAATHGPMPAMYAAVLYGLVHFIEGNLLTPLVQAEVVKLPPVLTIFATLGFGLLLGPVGVFLATPLTIVLLVAINTLYIEDLLGESRTWPAF